MAVVPETMKQRTVSTILTILQQKEFVGYETFGKSYRYYPLVGKNDYARFYFDSFLVSKHLQTRLISVLQSTNIMHLSIPAKWQTGLLLCLFTLGLNPGLFAQGNPPQPTNLKSVYQQIVYPKAAIEAGKEGKVIVKILVGEKGEYRTHEYVGEPDVLFTGAIDRYISAPEFSPGHKNDKAGKAWIQLPFIFRL